MKIPKISWVFGGVGLLWIIVSIFQWMIYYPDISQFIFGGAIGFALIYLGYDHWWKRKTDERLKGFDEALDRAIEYTRELDDRIEKLEAKK